MHKLAQIIFDRKVKVRYSAFVALVAGAWHHGNPSLWRPISEQIRTDQNTLP